MIYEIPFSLSDIVIVDNGIAATVIGFAHYLSGAEVKVSWWNNGILHEAWVASWRCVKVAE
ncbi:MAG: hypothetical protein ACHQWH_02470 [Nitrososphaerales archaeon]